VLFVLQKAQRLGIEGFTPFVLRASGPRMELGGAAVWSMPYEAINSQYDLNIQIAEDAGRLSIYAIYNPDMFEKGTVDRLLGHYANVLDAVTTNPDLPVAAVPVVGPDDLASLAEWNATERLIMDVRVHEIISAQAGRTPDAVAVSSGEWRMTYAELDARSNRLAHRLGALGVERGSLVGLAVERGPSMVVGLLGILKAGAAYLPIDPAFPPGRVSFMLEDARVKVLVTESALTGLHDIGGFTAVKLDTDDLDTEPATAPEIPLTGEDLAYLIYTSGSTGRPKGVMIRHRAVTNFVASMAEAPGARGGQTWLATTTLSFDIANLELLLPLTVGAKVEVVSRADATDGSRLARAIRETRADVLQATPASWRLLLESGWEGSPGLTALCGGEALTRDLADRLLARSAALWNLYGPTETTIWSTVDRVEACEGAVSIGRPIRNTTAYVLDPRLRPVPTGVTGELFLGGDGLARGYLGRPALTAERFLPDHLAARPGARMYRTGDLARYRPDGSIECLGRTDGQVKVRGYRIELGEVEAALAAHPAIASAAVAVWDDRGGEKRLAAYVVPRDEELEVAALRGWLRRRLPVYMVPASFHPVVALPLTPNGKVDRRSLPAPDGLTALSGPREAAEPLSGPVQEGLAAIASEVLGREVLSAADDFFEMGGHSLSAARLIARVRETFGAELSLREIFEGSTIAALSARVESASREPSGSVLPPLLPREAIGPVPASFGQQRLWLLDRMEPGRPWYNVPAGVRVSGQLDLDALRVAFGRLVARHEALRTRFEDRDGLPVQVVGEAEPVSVEIEDVSSATDPAGEAGARAREVWWGPFDLEKGALLRAHVYRIGPDDYLLALAVHHIVSDGWSVGVLVREMVEQYAAAHQGDPPPLAGLPVQYADFSEWQRRWVDGGASGPDVEFWKDTLTGVPPLVLPTDFRRPASPSGRGSQVFRLLPASITEGVERLVRGESATPFMAFLAAFEVLLSRYSGQTDFAIGTPEAGRADPKCEGLIGFFVNTLALRADVSGDPTFREVVRRVKATTLSAFAHRFLPFEKVVQETAAPRDASRSPVFQVMFAFQNAPAAELSVDGLVLRATEVPAEVAKFDLTLTVDPIAGGARAALEYNTDLFEATTAERWLSQFEALLASALSAPDRPVAELEMTSAGEAGLVASWSRRDGAAPAVSSVLDWIETTAKNHPGAIAVTARDGSLTYGELNARANALAWRLIEAGVGPDDPVALSAGRSAATVVGLLGVLKSGGAYVPLDPDYPPARLEFLLQDCGARVLISQDDSIDGPGTSRLLRIEPGDVASAAPSSPQNPPRRARPDNLAYVIYTSGSMGEPKGVGVTHRNLVRSTHARFLEYPGAVRSYLLASSFAFDSSVAGIFWTLCEGGTLVLPSAAESADPLSLARLVQDAGVTHLLAVPSLYAGVLQQPEYLGSLGTVIVAGEPCPTDLVARHFSSLPGAALHNEYGPTEATVWASVHRCSAEDGGRCSVPIGRPVAHSRAYVLDAGGRPVPPGVPGELWVGGEGIARGYLGRPGLTAERFSADPFECEPGARLYRTGDLVRWTSAGTLEFLGRADGQVKVRGVRIEFGEVESALRAYPGVTDAVADARGGPGGDTRLVAFLVPRAGAEVGVAGLRAWLRERLPEAFVPSAFALIDTVPLSPNGKTDRKALPPSPEWLATGESSSIPVGPIEEAIHSYFAEVLGRDGFGTRDDFFDLGGHSLSGAQLLARVRAAFGTDLPLAVLFEAPTVASLALRVEQAVRASSGLTMPPLERRASAGPVPASFGQRRLWLLDRMEPGQPWYNVPVGVRLSGDLDVESLRLAFGELVRRHASLRTTIQESGGVPVQVVSPPWAFELQVEDISAHGSPEEDAARLAREVWAEPFDLAEGPLLRARLYRTAPDEHLLALASHHAVSDAWSASVMVREIVALYSAYSEGRPGPLVEPALQYADYTEWQREWVDGGGVEIDVAYWREALAHVPPLELPTDRPYPERPTGRGGQCGLQLDMEVSERVAKLARQENATPFMVLLAAFQGLLSRYSGQTDFAVGTPEAGRWDAQAEGLIGFFVNPLALRADVSGRPGIRGLLRRVRAVSLAAFAHRRVPFEVVVREVLAHRDRRRPPVFQVMFSLQNAPEPRFEAAGLVLSEREIVTEFAKYDLTLNLTSKPDGLRAVLEYSTDLFDGTTAVRVLNHFGAMLTEALDDPDRPIDEILLADDSVDRPTPASMTPPELTRPNSEGEAREGFDAYDVELLTDDEVGTLLGILLRVERPAHD
jgi:amino acid adenylation domain-containing protein